MNYKNLFIGNNKTITPFLIIWDVNFTSEDDDPYFISLIPEETKAELTQNYLGIDLSVDCEEEEYSFFSSDGCQYCISSWKNFLNTATDYQINDAVSYMAELATYF